MSEGSDIKNQKVRAENGVQKSVKYRVQTQNILNAYLHGGTCLWYFSKRHMEGAANGILTEGGLNELFPVAFE